MSPEFNASPEVELWPMISWSAHNIHQLALVHLDSWPARDSAERGASGQSVWVGMVPSGLVGLGWEWAQVAPGVVALVDPLAVRSNLLLLGSDGSRLGPSAAALLHNRLLAGLDWQPEAMRALKRTRRVDSIHWRPSASAMHS